MLKFIDDWLDRITMYRLMLYYLMFLFGGAVAFSFVRVLTFDPFALLFTFAIILFISWVTNWIFAKVFAVSANAESVYISALILALIISPIAAWHDLWFLLWASVWTMASKYIVAIGKKHIFNPIAFAVALTYFAINQSASWWVGGAQMLPFVVIGGLLIVRKIRRFALLVSFLASIFVTTCFLGLLTGEDLGGTIQRTILYSPLLFFAFVILTEPLTAPPTQRLRIAYGGLIGILSAPQIHFGSFYITPEIAILIGNVFSFVLGSRTTLVLTLKQKIKVAPDVYDFIFTPDRKLAYVPGQYLELTIGHDFPDSRGNRRYFTLASSPTENDLRVGIKFAKNSSSYKRAMLAMNNLREIVAAQVGGDFVLPKDPKQKCVFIAGGIGVTPFRSMIQYLLDTHQPRPIVHFYVNRSANDIVYREVFERARKELGIETYYAVTEKSESAPGEFLGRITPRLLKAQVPDYKERIFYISGSKQMVDSFRQTLGELQVQGNRIKTDFFAGLS